MGTVLQYIGTSARALIGECEFEPNGPPKNVPDELARRVLRRPGSEKEWSVVREGAEEPETAAEPEPEPEPDLPEVELSADPDDAEALLEDVTDEDGGDGTPSIFTR